MAARTGRRAVAARDQKAPPRIDADGGRSSRCAAGGPDVKNKAWVRTPVDAFILATLEAKGLTPTPAADKATLIRRLTYDLHGFAADARRDRRLSQGRVAGRLMKSWSIACWLAALRRALGSLLARHRPLRRHARLRQRQTPRSSLAVPRLCHRSLNADKTYTRFSKEQLAGDCACTRMIPTASCDGFHRGGTVGLRRQVELREGTVEKEKTRLWIATTWCRTRWPPSPV